MKRTLLPIIALVGYGWAAAEDVRLERLEAACNRAKQELQEPPAEARC